MNRFGDITEREIDENAIKSVPKNTEKGKNSVWIQFMSFYTEKSTHLIYHWFQVFCTVAGKKKGSHHLNVSVIKALITHLDFDVTEK
jgi:hypothetical protein